MPGPKILNATTDTTTRPDPHDRLSRVYTLICQSATLGNMMRKVMHEGTEVIMRAEPWIGYAEARDRIVAVFEARVLDLADDPANDAATDVQIAHLVLGELS